VANGWGVQGVTVAQSGEPFSVIDFSGAAGSIFFSADDFITNPILPLAPGISPKKATEGGTDNAFTSGPLTGVRVPYVNPNDFSIPFLSPGQSGVPPCGPTTAGTTTCDSLETSYGSNGRNIFRSPFQTRFDFSAFKNFTFEKRYALKLQADAFNIFNQPSFDAPDTDFELNTDFNPFPSFLNPTQVLSPSHPNPKNYGVIRQSVGSNRFLQLSMHLVF
jgi:hypothetical protein